MILTGEMISSDEALAMGLISSVHSPDDLMPNALKMANKIASFSHPVVRVAKECVN